MAMTANAINSARLRYHESLTHTDWAYVHDCGQRFWNEPQLIRHSYVCAHRSEAELAAIIERVPRKNRQRLPPSVQKAIDRRVNGHRETSSEHNLPATIAAAEAAVREASAIKRQLEQETGGRLRQFQPSEEDVVELVRLIMLMFKDV